MYYYWVVDLLSHVWSLLAHQEHKYYLWSIIVKELLLSDLSQLLVESNELDQWWLGLKEKKIMESINAYRSRYQWQSFCRVIIRKRPPRSRVIIQKQLYTLEVLSRKTTLLWSRHSVTTTAHDWFLPRKKMEIVQQVWKIFISILRLNQFQHTKWFWNWMRSKLLYEYIFSDCIKSCLVKMKVRIGESVPECVWRRVTIQSGHQVSSPIAQIPPCAACYSWVIKRCYWSHISWFQCWELSPAMWSISFQLQWPSSPHTSQQHPTTNVVSLVQTVSQRVNIIQCSGLKMLVVEAG